MATVTVVTADKTLAIEAATIVSGDIDASGHLILTRFDGGSIDAGVVTTVDASVTQKGVVELATSAETIAGTDAVRAVTPAGLAAVPGTKVQVVTGLAETDIPSAFPQGISMQSVTNGSGWTPNNGYGMVVTFNISNNRCTQVLYASAGGTTAPNSWVRSYNAADGGGGWTTWSQTPLINNLAPADNDIIQRKANVWVNRTLAQLSTDLIATPSLAASASQKGIVELATTAETITGTDSLRAVTPAGLAGTVSTATQKGIVELATSAEVLAGTDTVRAVTPAGLASYTGRNDLGIHVPSGWGQFWKPKRDGAGTGLATIAAVGSSSTQGLYASNLITTSFMAKIMTSLQTTYGDGGSGYFSSSRSTLWMTASTPVNAWAALSGNFASLSGADWGVGSPYGPAGVYLYTQTVGNTITFTFKGTKCRIYTVSGGGRSNWSYAIDGGSSVAVTDSGTPGDTIQVTTTATLSAGSHTIVLTKAGSAGTTFGVHGVTGENATGVVMNNFGISGASSSYYAGTGFTDPYGIGRWSGGPDYPADLIIYATGANDANSGMDGDSWAANLRVFLQGVKDGQTVGGVKATGTTDVLILMQHIGQYDTANIKWQDYVAKARPIADAYNAALVNMWTLGRNSWNYWNTLGYWGNSTASGGVAGTDSIHMSDAGHNAVANAILPVLTS